MANRIYKTIIGITVCLLALEVSGQAFEQAPRLDRSVKEIVEWHRVDSKAKPVKKATSVYDKQGNLIKHAVHGQDGTKENSYTYDRLNRLQQKREIFEDVIYSTKWIYRKNLAIEERSFHGKTYRTCYYYKGQQLVEKKEFVKGGELENKYLLLRQSHFSYTAKDSLQSEKIKTFALRGRKKGQQIFVEKTLYHYDPKIHSKTHIQFYNADNSLRMERYFAYNDQALCKSILDYYHLEKRIASTEFLYKEGHIWQKIEESENQKEVLIYLKGRPIRLRSYLDGTLVKMVDYSYSYF